MTDIVERLRKWDWHGNNGTDCEEAADEIERLRAELTDAQHMLSIAVADYAGEKARAEKAEAALREIAGVAPWSEAKHCVHIAVEALAQKEASK